MTFEEMRADFLARRRGSLSLPIAGALVYAMAAALSLVVAPAHRNLLLLVAFWTIPPLGAAVMRLRGERAGDPQVNLLFALSAQMRLMVLATWAIHLPVYFVAPDLFPLTMGVGFGLHWAVFGWIIGRPLGLLHLVLRTALVLAAWWLVPANRMGAVCLAVACAYAVSVAQLARIVPPPRR